MHGAIPPLPQYDLMMWCLVKIKAQGQLYLYVAYGNTVVPYTMFMLLI